MSSRPPDAVVVLDIPRDAAKAETLARIGPVFWLQSASDLQCAMHEAGVRIATFLCFWSDWWVEQAAAYLRDTGVGHLEPEMRRKARVVGNSEVDASAFVRMVKSLRSP